MCSVSICRVRRGQTVELPFCCCCCFSCFCFCLILVNVYFYFGLTTKVQRVRLHCQYSIIRPLPNSATPSCIRLLSCEIFSKMFTFSFSVKMVVMWLSGDSFKTCYFIVKSAPVQFWLCGMIQICIDIAIIFQVYTYGREGIRIHLR